MNKSFSCHFIVSGVKNKSISFSKEDKSDFILPVQTFFAISKNTFGRVVSHTYSDTTETFITRINMDGEVENKDIELFTSQMKHLGWLVL